MHIILYKGVGCLYIFENDKIISYVGSNIGILSCTRIQEGWMFIYIWNDKIISDVGSNIGMFTVAAAAANFK